jgi:hypothetical protein
MKTIKIDLSIGACQDVLKDVPDIPTILDSYGFDEDEIALIMTPPPAE